MLLRVGIDPDAPEDLGGTGPGPLVLRYLRERCVLVSDSSAARASLIERLSHGPQELRQALSLLLSSPSRCVDRVGPLPIDQITEPEDVSSWIGVADLLLLAQYRADALAETGALLDPECSTFTGAANTRAFDLMFSSWERHAPVGESREVLWKEVFGPIAQHTETVYITDRYAAKSLADALRANARAKHQSGPQWFLSRLARTHVKTIHLASSEREVRNARLDPQDSKELIQRWFSGMSTGTTLEVHLVEGDFKHGRRILFDGWVGFDVHNGLQSFENVRPEEEVDLNASASLGREGRLEFARLVAGATS